MSSEDRGESSKSDDCPWNDPDALVSEANVFFLSLTFCDVVLVGCGGDCRFGTSCWLLTCSGESDGKEVREGSRFSDEILDDVDAVLGVRRAG
jgi:hypothetical protein